MLKKWNVSSPDDIPADKKDDFFKAVDKGYKAKNEDCGLKHEDNPAGAYGVLGPDEDEEEVEEGRPTWKYQTKKPGEPSKDDEEDGPPVWDYQK